MFFQFLSTIKVNFVAKIMQSAYVSVVFHFKGAVSRQSSSFCLILPITRPQLLWNLQRNYV